MAIRGHGWQREVLKVCHNKLHGLLRPCLHLSAERNMKQVGGSEEQTPWLIVSIIIQLIMVTVT